MAAVEVAVLSVLPQAANQSVEVAGSNLLGLLIGAAHHAAVDLRAIRGRSDLESIRAENRDLDQALATASQKLRDISLEHERALPIDFDRLCLAEQIEANLALVRRVNFTLAQNVNPMQRERTIALEFTLQVGRTLEEHGVEVSATAASGRGRLGPPSIAIQVLKAIGDVIGLVRTNEVWRDLLAEAKRSM